MAEDSYLFITTLSQLDQCFTLISQRAISEKGLIVLVSESIGIRRIQDKLNVGEEKVFVIPQKQVSLSNLLKNPLVEVPKHRNFVKEYGVLAKAVLQAYPAPSSPIVYFGSDKDIFFQLFLNELGYPKADINLIAYDEGLGYYKEPSWRKPVFGALYTLFSGLIFGKRIRYIEVLGTLPGISKVYLRYPELMPRGTSRSEIHHIKQISGAPPFNSGLIAKDILFIGSPLSEDGHYSVLDEEKMLRKVFFDLERKNLTVDIKPHPRELKTKYESFCQRENINILPSGIRAEELDYSVYNWVIHFGSSVVLDLYERSYPLSRIITLDAGIIKSKVLMRLYSKGFWIDLKREKASDLDMSMIIED